MEATKVEGIIEENKREIMIWEIIGGVVIIALGSIFHFMFEWLGEAPWIGWLFAVNESVWEHLKLGFWPALIFYGIEFAFLRKKVNNFFIAKATAMYFNPVAIIMLFYTYTGALGFDSVIVDILLFALVAAIQQVISYKILITDSLPEKQLLILTIISAVAIGILLIMMVLFTYVPPRIPLFEDGEFPGNYGIF